MERGRGNCYSVRPARSQGHSKDLISKHSDLGNWLILNKREMIYFRCELLNGGAPVDQTAYTFL